MRFPLQSTAAMLNLLKDMMSVFNLSTWSWKDDKWQVTPLPSPLIWTKLVRRVTPAINLDSKSSNMAAALGLLHQINRISVRRLQPRLSQLRCFHNRIFQQNHGLAKLRLTSTEPGRNVQMQNGKSAHVFVLLISPANSTWLWTLVVFDIWTGNFNKLAFSSENLPVFFP